MLAKAGVPCEDNLDLDGHTQVSGRDPPTMMSSQTPKLPSLSLTQVHNLLELVRKEQVIYNICFHEIIRQVKICTRPSDHT